ncbi:hypothetical protein N027_23490 [Pseudomonas syringae USA007]|uniref:Uncharacterized protein n=1 Tax=Pseudomonas syringae USA007 TaxID=1357288 RepID=A0AAU8M7G1_PSESX|nr:hypothetical protein [Pseudomonas syringae]
MNYYYIEPEVAGGLGEQTIMDINCWPPKVSKLEYRFEGWLGDELLEMFPCFICTYALANALSTCKLSGMSFGPVITSKSEDFLELYPNTSLPDFYWLQVHGAAGADDFGIAQNNRLVISDSVMNIIKKFNINHADITDFSN